MIITNAQRIALNIPFYAPHVTRAMHRGQSFDERVYLYRLETDNDLVAHADSTVSTPVDHLIGQNPYAIMHDDRIGFGPQVACLDLVGKDAGVPVHALLGTRIRGRYPISWWDIDMPPADWAAEARESVVRGYASFKMKARPWRDIFAQVEAAAEVVPGDYKFDIDFNGFLLDQAGDIDFHPAIDTVLCDSVHILNHELAVQHLPTRMYQRKRKGAVMGNRFTDSHPSPGPATIMKLQQPAYSLDSTRLNSRHR